MDIIVGNSAAILRNKYISDYIDVNSQHYIDNVATLKDYDDGACYTGYLWECFDNSSIVDEETARTMIMNVQTQIYVMWDIHSCKKIYIENYWKYPKDAVICVNASEFVEYENTFPEDIYVFNDDFSWSITLTHEYIDNKRICLVPTKTNT